MAGGMASLRRTEIRLLSAGCNCVVGKAVAYWTGSTPVGERVIFGAGRFQCDLPSPRLGLALWQPATEESDARRYE